MLKVIGRGAFGEVAVVRMRNTEKVRSFTLEASLLTLSALKKAKRRKEKRNEGNNLFE